MNINNIHDIINYLGDKEPENHIYQLLTADSERPLAEFIMMNPQHKILRHLINYPNMGICEYIENDINNPELDEIDANPALLMDIMKDSGNPFFRELVDGNKKMAERLDKIATSFASLRELPNPVIHYLEYKQNFHRLFSEEEIDDEYYTRAFGSWIMVSRSPSAKVDIVDSDGNIMFTHPGLMGEVDHTMGKDNWVKFKAYSVANRNMGGTFCSQFQENHINEFLKANDSFKDWYNEEGINNIIRINAYFDSIDDDGNPLEVKDVKKLTSLKEDVEVRTDEIGEPTFESDDGNYNMSLFD